MTEYQNGYNRALADINQPMVVVTEAWDPSECPRCGRDFAEFEPCYDGYYDRVTSMERCPYCGQKLCWGRVNQ
ncbi:MAG: hypothetical protein RR365_02110 [Bacteroides sp.]